MWTHHYYEQESTPPGELTGTALAVTHSCYYGITEAYSVATEQFYCISLDKADILITSLRLSLRVRRQLQSFHNRITPFAVH